jgi:nucleotide-binding universal stress UspA family protein
VVEDGPSPAPLPRAAREAAAQRELDAFVRGRRPRARGVQCKVRAGVAADEILAEASEWGADLVVLGTGGSAGAGRFHLGSTAGAALRGAPCNVLAVPPAPRPEQMPAIPAVEALAAPLPAA